MAGGSRRGGGRVRRRGGGGSGGGSGGPGGGRGNRRAGDETGRSWLPILIGVTTMAALILVLIFSLRGGGIGDGAGGALSFDSMEGIEPVDYLDFLRSSGVIPAAGVVAVTVPDWPGEAGDANMANHFAAFGEPVIVTESDAKTKWNAVHKWDPLYLASGLSTPDTEMLADVRIHTREMIEAYTGRSSYAAFRYFDLHPFASYAGVKDMFYTRAGVAENMTITEFFHAASNPEGDYVRYEGYLDDFGPYLFADAEPLDSFVVQDQFYDLETAHTYRTTSVILEGKDVVNELHYTTTHRWLTVAFGQMQVLLVSPEMMLKNGYLLPFLHPGARSSQVSVLDLGTDGSEYQARPRLEYLTGVGGVLFRGDSLYVPPGWGLLTASQFVSASIQVQTLNPELAAWGEVLEAPLPFKRGWSKVKIALAARVYLSLALEATLGSPREVKPFVKQLLEQRYLPLKGVVVEIFDRSRSYCESALEDIDEDVYMEKWTDPRDWVEWEEVADHVVVFADDILDEMFDDFRKHSEWVAEGLAPISDPWLRQNCLMEFVELLAHAGVSFGVGSGTFLQQFVRC